MAIIGDAQAGDGGKQRGSERRGDDGWQGEAKQRSSDDDEDDDWRPPTAPAPAPVAPRANNGRDNGEKPRPGRRRNRDGSKSRDDEEDTAAAQPPPAEPAPVAPAPSAPATPAAPAASQPAPTPSAPAPTTATGINVSTGQPRRASSNRASQTERRRSNAERVFGGVLGAGAGLTVGAGGLGVGAAAAAGGGDGSGGSPGGGSGGSGSGGDAEERSSVRRTVSDIVEVVPETVKMLLVALAVLAAALGGGYLLLAERGRRLARQRSDLLQEVGLLQTALLPPVPATVGAVRTSVAYRPSDGPGAGGDFYDALTLPGGRAAFILGDVSGHGRQALARTAFMRYTLRAYLEAGLEPRIALQVAGSVIDEHLAGDFATVVLAVHDPSSGSLTYACAGHPAPIVVGATQPEPVLAASSPPIGLGMRTGLRQTTLPLPAGSVVCLYTDGLAEARTEKSILGRPRLGDIVGELGRDATAAQLLDRVSREARLVTDDMATVMITPTAGVTAGGFRSEQIEIDPAEAEDGIAESFLEACGVETGQALRCADEVAALCKSHGGAVMHVRFGMRGPQVEVLPRNVESFELAQRRAATA